MKVFIMIIKQIFSPVIHLTLGLTLASTCVQAESITKKLKTDKKLDDVSTIYKDIVVVQRKAKVKKGSFLLHPSLVLDFSDGPQTLYGLNLNIGYAISDFWEVYLHTTPAFIAQDRKIVEVLERENLEVEIAEPEWQAGLEIPPKNSN